jgi:hypothetical protein
VKENCVRRLAKTPPELESILACHSVYNRVAFTTDRARAHNAYNNANAPDVCDDTQAVC